MQQGLLFAPVVAELSEGVNRITTFVSVRVHGGKLAISSPLLAHTAPIYADAAGPWPSCGCLVRCMWMPMARCWLRWLIYGVEEVWMASKQSRLQGDGKAGAWGGVLELGGRALARGPSDGTDVQGHKTLIVKMKYVDGAPAITAINRTSTPGRRIYSAYTEIPRVLNGLGIAIVSTSKGLMKDADCRRNKAGGELICNVW